MYSTNSSLAFHILAKPTGAICNLNCSYCFFLAKESLYPDSRFWMTDKESHLREYLTAQRIPRATITWQGGEPTLVGLDFYRRSITCSSK